jgi:hypothetical protein
MLVIGATDDFEQKYMAKFQELAAQHGMIVKYERDRAARDIGVHLTKGRKGGGRHVADSIVWFQMKGLMAATLPAGEFESTDAVSLSLSVEHLRHWYLEKEPTHLVVYVESVDQFLVLNLQSYVNEKWGHKILELDQKTATVTIPKSSTLDDQAFSILLRYADVALWCKALNASPADVEIIHRDFDLIHALGTAGDRKVEHALRWIDWISKTRDEVSIVERPVGEDDEIEEGWAQIREHWEYMGISLGDRYPYLDLFALEDYDPDDNDSWDEEGDDGKLVTLKNGDEVFGQNACNEYYYFIFGARINDYGLALFSHVQTLVRIGLLELGEPGEERGMISIAPWHGRHV